MLMLSVAASVSAVETVINGLWYDILKKAKEAKVIQNKNYPYYSGDIVIPETVEYEGVSCNVTSISDRAFFQCYSLTSMKIPSSVTSIGNQAFFGCSGLTSMTIPNSVTSIGSEAFNSCSFTSVSIPNSVTSIGGGAFRLCSRLTSVTIPNSVTSISSYTFSDCSGLTSVTIPNSVTAIESNAFSGCTGLTTVTIGNSVTEINIQAFANCSSLTDIYCLAENVPSTDSDAFVGSSINTATLHVPDASIVAYQSTAPWNGFKAIVGLNGTTPDTKKCATPTISLVDGELVFGCETEGVEFVSEVTVSDAKKYYDSKVSLSGTYKVSVYATKAGYDNSDVATAEFNMSAGSGKKGDINADGTVNAIDVQEVINIAADDE